ncbi:MAG: proteasome accessory factor PafA2 family protein [Fimbriimonadaceae bacterium]
MSLEHGRRIFGVETEFGTLSTGALTHYNQNVVESIVDTIFLDQGHGVIDLHARDDIFEPAASGGFLVNGARLYIDAVGSHLEYATSECQQLKDLVANDRAGQRLILQAMHELDYGDEVAIYNNSVDHFGGHTFGCHENYLIRIDEDFLNTSVLGLYPFLVTRQIFSGVGRVGGHVLGQGGKRPTYQDVVDHPVDYIWVSHVYSVKPDPKVKFQLSQRADHILKPIASRVRFNRALINPKWDHFYNFDGLTRLHLLFGESNQNEFAYALKIGTTSMVLRLVEERKIPASLRLMDPIETLRSVSRDETMTWPVLLADGSTISAIELQRRYLELCAEYRGESEQGDWVLDEWEAILDGLETNPMALGDRIDWVAKRQIVEQYMADAGVDWSDDSLHSVDLEYHNIDPEQSLFYAWQDLGNTRRICTDIDIMEAMTEAPQDTRALGRSMLVRKVLERRDLRHYAFDWNAVQLGPGTYVEMPNPFETYANP